MAHCNPYAQLLLEKGYTKREINQIKSRTKRTFPCTIGLRHFATEQEYMDALHEFLNGY